MPEGLLPLGVLLLFFLVAVLYSSVGHGGATGYLGLFAFLGAATTLVVPVALILNVLVAGTGFIVYKRSGHFSFSLLAPFLVASIPAAFLGGLLRIEVAEFHLILGMVLLLAGLRMLFFRTVRLKKACMIPGSNVLLSGLIGFVLGIVSGVVGIGGGVFLSPIILFLGWADARQTAAVSSAFIVLNSLSGLLGQFAKGNMLNDSLWLLLIIVFIGALLGSTLGAKHVRIQLLQILLGIVLFGAGGKMIVQVLV